MQKFKNYKTKQKKKLFLYRPVHPKSVGTPNTWLVHLLFKPYETLAFWYRYMYQYSQYWYGINHLGLKCSFPNRYLTHQWEHVPYIDKLYNRIEDFSNVWADIDILTDTRKKNFKKKCYLGFIKYICQRYIISMSGKTFYSLMQIALLFDMIFITLLMSVPPIFWRNEME